MKILMVCLGNICRSPLAEGILQQKADELGLDWQIDSAGTSGWHANEPPDRRAQRVAKKNDVDIAKQRSRMLQGYDLEEYDLVYAMDSANYNDILRLAKTADEEQKIKLILNEIYPDENIGVPDPYWDDNGFEQVFEMLNNACEKIIQTYRKLE